VALQITPLTARSPPDRVHDEPPPPRST